MKNYEKPVVMINDELAEGVYAASGDHWSVNARPVQELDGKQIWEIVLTGITGVVDDEGDKGIVLTLTFSETVTEAVFRDMGYGTNVSASGNQVTVQFSDVWCRHVDNQTVSTKIDVTPASASVVSSTVDCRH